MVVPFQHSADEVFHCFLKTAHLHVRFLQHEQTQMLASAVYMVVGSIVGTDCWGQEVDTFVLAEVLARYKGLQSGNDDFEKRKQMDLTAPNFETSLVSNISIRNGSSSHIFLKECKATTKEILRCRWFPLGKDDNAWNESFHLQRVIWHLWFRNPQKKSSKIWCSPKLSKTDWRSSSFKTSKAFYHMIEGYEDSFSVTRFLFS